MFTFSDCFFNYFFCLSPCIVCTFAQALGVALEVSGLGLLNL
uniref:Uncharacterized protein n=1 Tax=Anguilla anguilla TaxID=7936 RepID=A0A0E9UKC7_ANGAN